VVLLVFSYAELLELLDLLLEDWLLTVLSEPGTSTPPVPSLEETEVLGDSEVLLVSGWEAELLLDGSATEDTGFELELSAVVVAKAATVNTDIANSIVNKRIKNRLVIFFLFIFIFITYPLKNKHWTLQSDKYNNIIQSNSNTTVNL
jgi:hypothetical protein